MTNMYDILATLEEAKRAMERVPVLEMDLATSRDHSEHQRQQIAHLELKLHNLREELSGANLRIRSLEVERDEALFRSLEEADKADQARRTLEGIIGAASGYISAVAPPVEVAVAVPEVEAVPEPEVQAEPQATPEDRDSPIPTADSIPTTSQSTPVGTVPDSESAKPSPLPIFDVAETTPSDPWPYIGRPSSDKPADMTWNTWESGGGYVPFWVLDKSMT